MKEFLLYNPLLVTIFIMLSLMVFLLIKNKAKRTSNKEIAELKSRVYELEKKNQ